MNLVFSYLFILLHFFYQPVKKTNLYYLHKASSLNEKAPLLILLHGVGSNEKDLFSFASQIPDKYHVISLRAPFVLGEESFAWYQVDFINSKPHINVKQAEVSRIMLIEFLENLKSDFKYDASQVYLCGFSQGAIMSYSVALSRPDLVKGFAAMSGRMLEEHKPNFASKEKLKNLKILITHGNADPVLNVEYANQATLFLKEKGLKPELKLYEEGHTINAAMLIELIKWLR
ncbi:MAG: alpha/beta hydrolase [Bacteroidia bacterium]